MSATASSFLPPEPPASRLARQSTLFPVRGQTVSPPDAQSLDFDLTDDAPVESRSLDMDQADALRLTVPLAGIREALAPLVTGVMPVGPDGEPLDPDTIPAGRADHEARRRALQRAVAELAETHAIAAELASRRSAIDLPLDLPDASNDAGPIDPVGAAPFALIVPDMIRACRDRVAAHASPGDRMKIDIVASLFDQVLADDRLSTGIRNTLARLQLPVLRIALTDESFFASRTHPTRRLLERLSASAVQWNLETDAGQASRVELERVVYSVVQGSSDDAGAHARLLESFERAILEIASVVRPSAGTAITDPEDRDVLVIKATIQISQLLAGVDVDRAIRFFLLDVWSRVLVEIACRKADHARDAMLARAKRLCFDLAWSAAPKTTTGERARLAGLLPTMIAALREGMALIGYPAVDQDRFLAQWTRSLYIATKRSHLVTDSRYPVRPDDPIPTVGLDIDAFALRLREGSFGIDPTPIPSDFLPVVDEGLRPLTDDPPSLMRTDSSGERRGSGRRAAAPTRPEIASMVKGAWFELREPRGFARVRLSWISPLKSFYLFVGADSPLTRSFDPEALADLIERGDLRCIGR